MEKTDIVMFYFSVIYFVIFIRRLEKLYLEIILILEWFGVIL